MSSYIHRPLYVHCTSSQITNRLSYFMFKSSVLSAFANATFQPHHQYACYSDKKSINGRCHYGWHLHGSQSATAMVHSQLGSVPGWLQLTYIDCTHRHCYTGQPAASGRRLIVVVWKFRVDNHCWVSILFPLTSVAPFNVVSAGEDLSPNACVDFQKSKITKIFSALFLVAFVFGSPLYLDTTRFFIFFSKHKIGTQQIWVSIIFWVHIAF